MPNTSKTAAVLSVSSDPAHHADLERVLDPQWRLQICAGFAGVMDALRSGQLPLVIYDCDSLRGSWRSVLPKVAFRTNAPAMIMTSRLADASLWAEALNLGAWDVLAKPFDAAEVSRVLASALDHVNRLFPTHHQTAAVA